MKRSDKPFKMKRSPFKIYAALATLAGKLGIKTLAGKAITKGLIKKGVQKFVTSKIGQEIGSQIVKNKLESIKNKKNQKNIIDSKETLTGGIRNFANINFGNPSKSSFTMKRNIKKQGNTLYQ